MTGQESGRSRLERPGLVCKLLVAALLLAFLAYVAQRGARRASDFKYVYGAARYVWTTGALNVRAQARYPVTFHVLLSPLAALPLGAAVAAWAVFSMVAVAALPAVIHRLTEIEPRRQLPAWALTAPFFIDALVLGQSDPINLLLVAAGLLAAAKGRGAIGMGLIGMAGLIKFLPLLHWATVVARRRSADAWIGMVLTFAFGLGILVAAVGWNDAVDGIGKQAELLRGRHSPRGIIERGADLRPNNESIPMVLVRLYGGSLQVADAAASTRLPLRTIFAIWYGSVAALAGAWLFALIPAARVPPERGWLAMFALTSIVMIASTPICWNHYFLWTMPAALFLLHRPKLLIMLALLSLGITMWPAARSLGCHMMMAIGLFAVVIHDLWREPVRRAHPAST
ncbi:MAG: glycosyltransferase 87 family protein [Isosphaeraceae bacterium]